MSPGLKETFRFLADTENEAAVDVLVAGLDCPHRGVRERALRALLARRSLRGHTEVFRRLSKLDERCRAIIGERPDRLARAARDALQTMEEAACAVAFNAIRSLRLYETMPALVAVLNDQNNPNAERTAQTILELTESFYKELSAPNRQARRHDMDSLRRRVTSALEEAVRRFDRHRRIEVVEAFLTVAKQHNVMLRRVLRQPGERTRDAVLGAMSNSSRGGVIRLLLGFLEDQQMPQSVRSILSARTDVKFVENLLRTTAPRPSRVVAKTLAGFNSFGWALPDHDVVGGLDSQTQESAVHLLMASSMPRDQVFAVLRFLLLEGKPGGRRAAAERLAEFAGPQADALVVQALEDEDPGVRAHLIRQVRRRPIPGGMSLLIGLVDSPHQEVRQALRDALPEFTYRQFLANFDSLPEELLPTAGHLVRKLDMEVRSKLTAEMEGRSPVKRRRAVLAAGAMGLIPEMEELIIKCLSDDDHMVRLAAAEALAECETMPTWDALRDALLDRSVMVQEAAEQSLIQISQSLRVEVEEEPEEVVS